jgi:hypothetical protein
VHVKRKTHLLKASTAEFMIQNVNRQNTVSRILLFFGGGEKCAEGERWINTTVYCTPFHLIIEARGR